MPQDGAARRSGAITSRLALLFRDWLRAHPAAVPYGSFKLALAQAVTDVYAYTEIKDLSSTSS